MKITIRGGHNYNIKGASDLVDEVTEDRPIYSSVIKYLKIDGHTVIDGTPERTNTKEEDLAYGVNIANKNQSDLFVSIHLNAYKRLNIPKGCEVLHYSRSTNGKKYAINIEAKLASLGFESRGAKADVRSLYELEHTNMTAVIVECFFVDSVVDVALYNKLGADKIGKAIAEGIVGHEIKLPTKFPLPLKMKYDSPAVRTNGISIELIKYFYRNDNITVRNEVKDMYELDVNGVTCYIPKSATTSR